MHIYVHTLVSHGASVNTTSVVLSILGEWEQPHLLECHTLSIYIYSHPVDPWKVAHYGMHAACIFTAFVKTGKYGTSVIRNRDSDNFHNSVATDIVNVVEKLLEVEFCSVT